MSGPPRRAGRRPGESGTREAILEAARGAFADLGYDRATIRAIARSAAVDPALVHHFFGTKDGLFAAAMRFPVAPSRILPQVLSGPRSRVGERVIRTFLAVWDSAEGGAAGLALLRSAVTNERAGRMLREFLSRELIGRVARETAPDAPELRASLVASQIVGLAMLRYLVPLDAVASADADRLAATVGPTVQRYLTGPLASGEPVSRSRRVGTPR